MDVAALTFVNPMNKQKMVLSNAAPGNYKWTATCQDATGAESDFLTIRYVVLAKPSATPVPSGAPKTGAGGSSRRDGETVGAIALAAAAASAVGLVNVRRRRFR